MFIHGVSEMKDIVVVTGYKRSGTSLMMRILQEIGYEPVVSQDLEKYLKKTVPKNEYFLEHIKHVYDGFEDGEIPEGSCVKVLCCKLDKIPKNCKTIFMMKDVFRILDSLNEYKTPTEMVGEQAILQKYDDWVQQYRQRFPEGMMIDFDDLVNEPEMVLKGGRFEKLIGKEVDFEKVSKLIWKK